MSDTVSIKIQLEGSQSVKTVTMSAKELADAFETVKNQTDRLSASLVNTAAIGQIADLAAGAFGRLDQMMSSLTTAYAEQKEADTKLAIVMRNTMEATQEEIASVREFIDLQERSGVVAGDVQTAAAQELATYLSMSSSLKTIIPTMNDMIVQQLGMNASAESAAQIATMLGKVMNGQTKALSRYGYEFSEAQEHILQFGDETERAAMLCEVIGQSVGGVNTGFSSIDIGRIQQLENILGKVEEDIGRGLVKVQPLVHWLAGAGQTAGGIIQLRGAIKSLGDIESVAAAHAKVQAMAQKILAAAGYDAAAGTTALRIATAALYATLTLGVTVAVTALVGLFSRLGDKAHEAADGIDGSAEAQQAYMSASMDMKLKLAEETVNLENLIKKKKATASAVRELNSEYGKTFGTHNTAKEWYEVLTKKSASYCRQLGFEAKAREIARQKASKEMELQGINEQIGSRQEEIRALSGGGMKSEFKRVGIEGEIIELQNQAAALSATISGLGADFDECSRQMAEAAEELDDVDGVSEEAAKQLEKLADDIKEYRKAVENASAANSVFGTSVSDAEARLSAMRSGLTSLIGKYGTESDSVRQLVTEYRELLKARDAANGTLLKPVTVPLEYTVKKMKDGRMQDVTETAYASVQNTPKLTRPVGQKSQRRQAEELYEKLQGMLPDASDFEADSIRAAMKKLEDLYDGIGKKGEKGMGGAADAVHALSAAMGGLSGVVDDAAASWLSWGANLLQVIGQALPALSSLFAANTSVAGSEAAASVASVPYVGPILAVAAVASIVAAMASLPKFAKGGLAYGPTLGLFGEYPGASGNPEVVAPLSDLTGILAGAGIGGGQLEFVIKGRRLVAINDKMNRYYGRNGQ